jgi:hypothetical protein
LRRLLIRPGAIGDCILSLPALQFLAVDYTEVWAPSAVCPLIRFASRVRALRGTGLDLVEIPGADTSHVIETLRGFDSIVSWYGANREEFRSRVQDLPFEFHAALPDEAGPFHAADFFLAQAGGQPPAIPRIAVPEVTRENFAVIHPYSGSTRKNWPLEHFEELAGRLPIPVRWCAGPEDPPLPNAVVIPDLYDIACWLASARLFIGNDSGIGHLAAAVGTPVVTIFGPMNPSVWAPRASKSRFVKAELSEVTVDAVLDASRQLLD